MREGSKKARREYDRLRWFVLTLCAALVSTPAFADDPTNISNGVSSITTWVRGIAVGIGALAVMGVGFAKLTGRMEWGRFFSVLTGIGIIFGAVQIVAWLSSGASGI